MNYEIIFTTKDNKNFYENIDKLKRKLFSEENGNIKIIEINKINEIMHRINFICDRTYVIKIINICFSLFNIIELNIKNK